MCEQVEGFDYLALSEPTPAKKFHRLGWINFKEGTDIKAAFDKLDNQKVLEIIQLDMSRQCALIYFSLSLLR